MFSFSVSMQLYMYQYEQFKTVLKVSTWTADMQKLDTTNLTDFKVLEKNGLQYIVYPGIIQGETVEKWSPTPWVCELGRSWY